MSYEDKFPDWEDQVRLASSIADSATEAAALLDIKYDTYRKYATKYGCFITNQAGKGLTKNRPSVISTEDILNGLHPSFQSNKLRLRLLEEGIFAHKCNSCQLTEWLGKPIPLELEHKDGCSYNHVLDNLELLCPNCHALTDTYRGKNKGKN